MNDIKHDQVDRKNIEINEIIIFTIERHLSYPIRYRRCIYI